MQMMMNNKFRQVNERYTLEVGCGGGKYRFAPKVTGENIVYLDIDKPSVKTKNFVRGDACHLPFKKETFAEIFASHIIEHLNDPHRFLEDSYFCLTSKGRVHIWCPNFLSSNAKKDPMHKHIFNFLSLRETLKQHNFRPAFRTTDLSDKIPKLLVYLFKISLLLLCNELYTVGIKEDKSQHLGGHS